MKNALIPFIIPDNYKSILYSAVFVEPDNSFDLLHTASFHHPYIVLETNSMPDPVTYTADNRYQGINKVLNPGKLFIFFHYDQQKEARYIQGIIKKQKTLRDNITGQSFESILFGIKSYTDTSQIRRNEITTLFLKEIHNKPITKLSYFLDKITITERHLRRLIKDQTGYSPKKLILLELLKKAYILIGLGQPLERTLLFNGFYDYSHFAKITKEYLRYTPKYISKNRTFLNMLLSIHGTTNADQ